MTKLPRYVRQRSSGAYEFRRNVPKDLVEILGKTHVYRYLGGDYRSMLRALPEVEGEVEAVFDQCRARGPREKTLVMVRQHFGDRAAEILADFNRNDLPGGISRGWLQSANLPPLHGARLSPEEPCVSLSEAFEIYQNFKGASNNKKMANSLRRAESDLLSALGINKVKRRSIHFLSRADATQYRDQLLQRVSANSAVRYINIVKAVINYAINEKGVNVVNPFHNLKVKGAGNNKGDRLPLSKVEAETILRSIPPKTDLHLIYMLLSDTGARIAEISGLQVKDVDLRKHCLTIQDNEIRSLKTKSSRRRIPLSPRASKALERCMAGKVASNPVFARYGRGGGNTACSAALMKYVRKVITEPKKTVHSLRHKKKDELRSTGCPEEISKVLLGHSSTEVAARYGAGFDGEILKAWMQKTWY
ncbi:tyrosine-type recombinase/integrase [Sulfitobacter sp. 1A12157]|uniref:tyrosine-type recombinase/integrase n=1 Tax=Sulfitobacter sp. 1A12157 TaxID=3368594 RepID=UPI003745B7D4